MKKKARKLVLAKETLHDLDSANLERIAGGDVTQVASCAVGSCAVSCWCITSRNSCGGSAYC
jgi:hypothetical protein